jgi:hypothetical protein
MSQQKKKPASSTWPDGKSKSLGEYLVRQVPGAVEEWEDAPPAPRKRSRGPKPGTIGAMALNLSECISFMNKGRAEAYTEAIAAGCDQQEASNSGNTAWRCLLPLLSSRPAVQVYIGCVAHGLARQYITAEEARVMMYSAQMALAVLKRAGAA